VTIVFHGPLSPEVLYSRSTHKDPEPPLALQEMICRVPTHQDSPPAGDESEIETGKSPEDSGDGEGVGLGIGEVVVDGRGVSSGLEEGD
jgi:hypothetical protein